MKSLKIAFLMESNMEFISSDTNIWIDFSIINKLDLPFKLPYIYLMDKDAIDDELLFPTNLKPDLLSLGLQQIEITLNELLLAEQYGTKYKKLSIYDRIALAIAKIRKITLLTGDGNLRKAAKIEFVNVIGTLGILDMLYFQKYINKNEYINCLKEFKKHNGKSIRLPIDEIENRLAINAKIKQ